MLDESKVQELRDSVNEHDDSKYPGMSYEQGIADALDAVLGNIEAEDLELG